MGTEHPIEAFVGLVLDKLDNDDTEGFQHVSMVVWKSTCTSLSIMKGIAVEPLLRLLIVFKLLH